MRRRRAVFGRSSFLRGDHAAPEPERRADSRDAVEDGPRHRGPRRRRDPRDAHDNTVGDHRGLGARESRRAGTGGVAFDEARAVPRRARRAARAFAFRPAGHGQDPHRARGGVAVRRDVLLHQRLQLDEQVDRRGGEDGARALRRRGGVRAGGDLRGRD